MPARNAAAQNDVLIFLLNGIAVGASLLSQERGMQDHDLVVFAGILPGVFARGAQHPFAHEDDLAVKGFEVGRGEAVELAAGRKGGRQIFSSASSFFCSARAAAISSFPGLVSTGRYIFA